jgi:hypothetical protein
MHHVAIQNANDVKLSATGKEIASEPHGFWLLKLCAESSGHIPVRPVSAAVIKTSVSGTLSSQCMCDLVFPFFFPHLKYVRTALIYRDKYVSRAEYDELRARVDRLETLLLSRAHQPSGFATLPGPEPSSSQTQQQQQLASTRLPAGTASGHQGPTAPVPYNSISPSSSSTQGAAFPAGLAGPSRVVAGSQDYGGAMALRAPNSPASGRTALPPLASLANGPAPFDGGPPPPSRLHREQHQHREHREREREQQHQPYAPLPPQPSLQQPLQQLHQQTKNYRAQTLIPLGERLRNCISLQGPAAVSRLHRHRSNSTRRLRLLMRGARGRRFHTAPAYRGLLLFLGPHRSGVPSVRSENGSSSQFIQHSRWGV